MFNKAKTLKGYKLHSLDGEIGKVEEFYFDDQHWSIRYLVANTGNWLTGRQVLISPYALVAVNKEEQYITINLTQKTDRGQSPTGSDKPVSRQFEEGYYEFYGWPLYWAATHNTRSMSPRIVLRWACRSPGWTVLYLSLGQIDGDVLLFLIHGDQRIG